MPIEPYPEDLEERTALALEAAREVLERAPAAVIVIEPVHGEVRYANDAARALLDIPTIPFRLTFADFVEERDRVTAKLAVRQWLRGERAVVELRVRAGDGSVRAVEVAGSVVPSAVGPPTVAAVARDVTERWRAQRQNVRYAELLRRADLAMLLDAEGRLRWISGSAKPMLGYDPDSQIGKVGFDFIHPDDVDRIRSWWDEAVRTRGSSGPVEFRVYAADGSVRWVEERATNLLHEPDVESIVVNISDITDRKQAEERLVERERFFHSVLSAAHDGIWVVDGDGRTLFVNEKAAEIVEETVEELYARRSVDYTGGMTREEAEARLARRRAGERAQDEIHYVTKRGTHKWLNVSAAPINGPDGTFTGSVLVISDVSDRKTLEDELARLALVDTATGLPNRTLFLDRLAVIERQREGSGVPYLVLCCDLDGLRAVNDARGVEAGDAVIDEVARRIADVLGPHDTLARVSGDEFAVLCPDGDEGSAHDLLAAISGALHDPIAVDGGEVVVTMCVGATVAHPGDGEDALANAYAALADAKRHGRGRTVLATSRSSARERREFDLASRLREALDAGEVQMHFQPIVRLDDNSVVGFETLARWRFGRSQVPPQEFLVAAERYGMAGRIAELALRAACEALPQLPDDLYVSVNLSFAQLEMPGLVEIASAALRRARIPAHRLVVEVTETTVLADAGFVRGVLDRFRGLGVRIAVDDFGTGYSSLSNLREFPVDIMKIDRSFVEGLAGDSARAEHDRAIIASLVALATSTGITAIAEGVETSEQAQALRRLGILHGQGFLWSTAVPVAELHDTLTRITRRRRRPAALLENEYADRALLQRIATLHRTGASASTIAAMLNAERLLTRRGTQWRPASVLKVLNDLKQSNEL